MIVALLLLVRGVILLLRAGPFTVTNMLDIERFQTVFKGCCRGTNAMMSILHHYQLLEVSLSNRSSAQQTWTVAPPRSSVAGHCIRPGSSVRTDRLWEAMGKGTRMVLDDSEFKAVVELWRAHDIGFDAFMTRFDVARRNGSCYRTGARALDFREWKPNSRNGALSLLEQSYQQMSNEVTVSLKNCCVLIVAFV